MQLGAVELPRPRYPRNSSREGNRMLGLGGATPPEGGKHRESHLEMLTVGGANDGTGSTEL